MRSVLPALTCVLLLTPHVLADAPGEKKATPTKLSKAQPRAATLRKHVLAVLASYPTDGTHRYWWPRGKQAKKNRRYTGTTRDIQYKGETVARGDGKGRCYCCGLTYEVFVLAWKRYCEQRKKPFDIAGLSAKELLRLRRHWYVATPDRSGCQGALVSRGLGRRVEANKARKGDFVQLWRRSGSGHSVIFIGWVREKGKITAIRYWSTQPATRGIGIHTERLSGKRGVDLEKCHFVRAGR